MKEEKILKKWINKLKSVKFWLSLTGAVVLVLQLLGVKISAPYINEIASAVCSVFVILGIMVRITKPRKAEQKSLNPAKSRRTPKTKTCKNSVPAGLCCFKKNFEKFGKNA